MSEEFYFDYEDEEFEMVKKLAVDWCKANQISSISNYEQGEALAINFEKHVKEQFPQIAKLVERDVMVYQAVLEYLNDSEEFDSSE